jgi:hypothetical protein
MNAAKQYVEQMLECHRIFREQGHKIIGDPTPVYEFVLANGKEYNGTKWTDFRGTGYRKMEMQMCFANAWYASLVRPELTYCEGFAYAGLIAVHHAWCVDGYSNRVVDFTWRRSVQNKLPEVEWEYFGVLFDSEAMREWWLKKDTASVLFDLPYDTGDPAENVIQVAA